MAILGTRKYDNLFAGDFDVVTESVTVGDNLVKGTVVGIITASKKAVAVDSSKSDGSEKPYGVLAEDAEADSIATVYLTGEFNENVLIFGGDDTAETHKRALREIGIFLKKNIEA